MVSVWLLLEVPGTRRFTLAERRQTVILKCNVRDSSMLLSLGYDVFLVILCTVYVLLLLHASTVIALYFFMLATLSILTHVLYTAAQN